MSLCSKEPREAEVLDEDDNDNDTENGDAADTDEHYDERLGREDYFPVQDDDELYDEGKHVVDDRLVVYCSG